MNPYLTKIAKLTILVLIWFGVLNLVGKYLVLNFPVEPSFPYYQTLLDHSRDQTKAIFGYFDGIHYLKIATNGYLDIGSQAFFPLYPILIDIFSNLFSLSPFVCGVVISLISLIGSLYCLALLFPSTYKSQTLLLLLFPTSFFFGMIYTESLFLFLSLLFFVLLKQKSYILASLVATLASSTRLVGVFLSLSLAYELYKSRKYSLLSSLTLLFISVSGFLFYSYYLYLSYGDPLMYLHVQSMFGASRSSSELILLPQVIFRYLKMIFSIDPSTFVYQRIWLELLVFIGGLYIWYRNLRVIPFSHSIYVISSLILPTLTGTLSSLPRYILVLLPFLFVNNLSGKKYLILYTTYTILLIYLFSNFVRGTFIA